MKTLTPYFFRALLFGLCIGGWYGCRDEHGVNQVREQYADGTLWMVKSMRGDQLHGRSLSYYPNGKIKSSTRWLNGRRTGVTRLYYSNGGVKDSSFFVNDSLHGLSLRYYHNGVLEQRAYFTNGTSTGTTMFYDSLGKPVQRHTYDKSGKLIYLSNYDSNGQSFGRMCSIIEVSDTINTGSFFTGCVRFGYPLMGKVTMLVGTLVTHPEAIDRYQIADTIAVIRPDTRGRFCFSYLPRPANLDRHVFGYKFIHTDSAIDSLSVNDKSGTVPFFVRQPKEVL